MTRAWTSTVSGVVPATASGAAGCALAALASLAGPVWIAVACGLLVAVVGSRLATVRLTVNADHVAFGWGHRGHLRVLDRRDVTAAEAIEIHGRQVYGLGVSTSRRTTRLTVRGGPALALHLVGGETVRISTSRPSVAVDLLALGASRAAGPAGSATGRSDR